MNSYGIAVRAGAVTPQVDDEDSFRHALGLPGMSTSVRGLWEQQSGYRLPVTLAGAGAAVGGDDGGSSVSDFEGSSPAVGSQES
ncbi:hypothetical protein E0H39_29675 [Rhizobium leguminosarum bv. viciae]|uniref:hypothetical protein n=1 Tax=Rhizobium leguminosarum TaxID=384 RepID=UPI0010399392|nr:hypothetical protein [Rhizobium leguminosarum]TBY57988.1 hypothetical protein E0H39_29675 [Rhizobium leguminosarum bv. viciae]